MAAIHNPHTTQKMTDRKQVVCRVVDHNYIEYNNDSSSLATVGNRFMKVTNYLA